MINNLQKLTNVIEFLKIHEVKISFADKSLSKEKINDLANDFKMMRKQFLQENIKKLKQKIKRNYKMIRVSALSLMEYNWDENSNSNILEYLINYNSFDQGAKLLSQIILNTSLPEKENLSKKILEETYTTYREYRISNGRIDLFILDSKEKFVIVIENKILAGIGESFDEDEIKVTQLEKYEKWCEENYTEYIRLYILLNFSNPDYKISLFDRISYKQVYDILKILKSDDNIFDEYLLLLDSLLNTEHKDLSEIKKLANKIIGHDSVEISLTEYYTLKTIFYAK